MKKILLTLIVFTFFISAAGAANSPGHIHIKKPLKLSDINDITDTQCDLCGCYMGLDPNFASNQVGIRVSSIKFFTKGDHAGTTGENMDHPDDGSVSSTEYYNDLEFYFRYYISPKFRVLFSIPFGSNEKNGKKLNGIGDAKLIAQYQVYNSPITGKTNFWQRLFLGGGFNIPTGIYNKQLTFGVVEPHFQPGTGSFDLIVAALHLAKLEKTGIGWRNDIIYTLNGKNKNQYSFGNRFNWTSTLFYEVPAMSLTFLPHAGVYFETAKQDKLNGQPVNSSGGDILFGTGGLDVYYEEFSLDFNYQFPLSEKFIGEQPKNKYRFYLGLGYSF
ncbi:MAG: hypothetical protein M3P82_05895 [Bacteroidota bacterium]|nr:hypothetical protein [Bacteroidota bacterium]